MRAGVLMLLTLMAGPVAAQTVAATSPDTQATLAQVSGAVLQADGPRARVLLQGLPAEALDAKAATFRDCVLQRLDPAEPEPPLAIDAPFPLRVLEAYRQYWREAAGRPEARAEVENALGARLGLLLGRPELHTLGEAEAPTLDRIRAEGWHALGGQVGLLKDLMLWRSQQERDVSVALPEGDHRVRLILLDDFESRGWSHWLTCGRASTGGWAKPEGLYAIVPAYDSLEDETFRINLLAHETQHFADNANFADLKGWELEVRAKLAELALAETTRETILARFASNQGDDPDDAHSYANRLVLSALRRRLQLEPTEDLATVPGADLRAAASAELRNDTRGRRVAKPS